MGKQKTDSIKEKINFFESEYKRIVNLSEEDYSYYSELLLQLLISHEKSGGVNGISETYEKICSDLINRAIKARIKYEKQIIYIKDLFKEVNIDI